MSYWGIIILINIIGILPFIGIIISKLIRSAVWVISNRIFLYHFLIGILISIILYFHIIILHNFSSINSYINNNTLIISFYPFIFKDLYCINILFILLFIFIYWEPDILGNSDNQIIANSSITPNNTLPEWYYLLFYNNLRCIPNKSISIIIIIYLFSFLFSLIIIILFLFNYFLLTFFFIPIPADPNRIKQ